MHGYHPDERRIFFPDLDSSLRLYFVQNDSLFAEYCQMFTEYYLYGLGLTLSLSITPSLRRITLWA